MFLHIFKGFIIISLSADHVGHLSLRKSVKFGQLKNVNIMWLQSDVIFVLQKIYSVHYYNKLDSYPPR